MCGTCCGTRNVSGTTHVACQSCHDCWLASQMWQHDMPQTEIARTPFVTTVNKIRSKCVADAAPNVAANEASHVVANAAPHWLPHRRKDCRSNCRHHMRHPKCCLLLHRGCNWGTPCWQVWQHACRHGFRPRARLLDARRKVRFKVIIHSFCVYYER